MKRLAWQTESQRQELAETGFDTYKALARARGVAPTTLLQRVKKGMPLAEAADPDTRLPPIAKRKRKAELLTAEQLADIAALGFESVRALSQASALSESCIYGRLRRGWSVDQAINAPLRVTKPLCDDKRAELHARGFATVSEFARAAGLTVNQVWDRWVRKGWSLDRVFEAPIRACVDESIPDRTAREAEELSSGMRTCVQCGHPHPLETYRASPASSNGRWRVCATCLSFALIELRYGLDRDAYEALWETQEGRCYGCGTDLGAPTCRVHVEHDHATGAVRGLACAYCNWTLGDFRDDPRFLRGAASWLEDHPGIPDAVEGEPQRSPGGEDRGYTLWRDHCMTVSDLDALVLRQGGACGICRTIEPASNGGWVVDHHHRERDAALREVGLDSRHPDDSRARSDEVVLAYRRTVRGVLCSPCNKGVGHAREDRERLLALAALMEP